MENTRSVLQLAAEANIPRSVELCRLLIDELPELVFVLANPATGRGYVSNLLVMPLHYACVYGYLPIVKCILDMCPSAIYGVSSNGSFPIHYAVNALSHFEVESLQTVKFLLSVNASVASQRITIEGPTPLIVACTFTTESNWRTALEVIKSLFNINILMRFLTLPDMLRC